MLRNYSSHFAGSTHFYSTKAGGRKMGLRGWGLTGTLIDMSSFYLFSLELRRHSETTFHYGVSPLTDAVRPDFFSRQIYCSNGPFSFPHETSLYEFVSRTIRAIALCIPTVHHFTRKIHAHTREQKISCSFFSASKRTVIATKTDLVTYYLHLYFAIERKALKNYFSYNKQLG